MPCPVGVFLSFREPWRTECSTWFLKHPGDFHAAAGALSPKTGAKLLEGKSQQHMKWKPISGFLSSPRSKQLGQGIVFLVGSLSLVDPSLFAVSLYLMTWSGWRCPCSLKESRTTWPLKVPSNSNYSMILYCKQKQCFSVFISMFSLGLASGPGGRDARQFWCSWDARQFLCSWDAYLKMADIFEKGI